MFWKGLNAARMIFWGLLCVLIAWISITIDAARGWYSLLGILGTGGFAVYYGIHAFSSYSKPQSTFPPGGHPVVSGRSSLAHGTSSGGPILPISDAMLPASAVRKRVRLEIGRKRQTGVTQFTLSLPEDEVDGAPAQWGVALAAAREVIQHESALVGEPEVHGIPGRRVAQFSIEFR